MKKPFLIFDKRRIMKWITAPMLLSVFINPSLVNATGFSGKATSRNTDAVAAKPSNFRDGNKVLQVITGKVIDKQGQPVIGATVVVKGTSTGTATNTDGTFSMDVPDNSAVLVFSYIGFKNQEVAIGNRTTFNITLEEDATALKEVLVVGYGTQSRETTTTAITKLDEKALESIPYTNAAAAMQGTLPGVRVQSTSGQPGATPRVIVRGGASIINNNGATPLYVIDGIQRAEMDNINPEDIESLQVLKDAASTAIYGARGSNGVVIVTTKSGKAGRTRLTYSYDMTVGKVGKVWNFASARDLIYYGRLSIQRAVDQGYQTATAGNARLNGAFSVGTGNDLTNNTAYTTQYLSEANKFKLNEGWESMPDPLDPTKTIIFKDTDFNDVLYQTAISHNHHVALSGGSEKATFNAGLGYLAGEGTAITTKYNRLTFNLNGDLKIKDNLSVFGRTMYTNSVNNIADPNLTFLRSSGLPRTAKYKFEDGTLAPGQAQGLGNQEYHLNNREDENKNETITLATGAHWELLPGLSFDPQISLYRINNAERRFQPSFQNGAGPGNLITSRLASNSVTSWNQYQADAILTYGTSFGSDHNLEAKAGFSYFGREYNTFAAIGQGASTNLIPTLNASSTFSGVSSTITNLVLPGYLARINYDFRKKYLLTVNARYDGASNLGANYKWGFFPGVAVGWNLHQEPFWQALPLPADLVNLKLRTSYGVNGNISNLGDFQAQGEFGIPNIITQQRYAGNVGIQQIILPNADLKWERSKTVNFGADLGLFNNRITVLFDAYRRVVDDLVQDYTLPPSSGFSTIRTNLASLENKGVEFELTANILPSTSAFNWNISFNAAKTKHKILSLPENGIENNRVGGIEVWDTNTQTYMWAPANGGLIEGQQFGDWYGYKPLGVYATEEAAKTAPLDNVVTGIVKTKHAGDVIWQDTDGNNIIDQRDKVYLGNAFPVWTGGFSSTLGYKNFSLYARFDYTLGHSIYNYARGFYDGNWQGDISPTQEFLDNAWKQEGDITNTPKYTYYDASSTHSLWRGQGNTGISGLLVEKGDFLCVREVTLSYNLPTAFLQKIRMSNLRLNVTGNNLHYFTNYSGVSPEDGNWTGASGSWGDRGRYPNPRNIIFGASISF